MNLILKILSQALFFSLLTYYLATNLQWYSYKVQRVLFHHRRYGWHVAYFFMPVAVYYALSFSQELLFYILIWVLFLPILFLWARKLDRKIVFTWRIRRFFAVITLLFVGLSATGLLDPIILFLSAILISNGIEKLNEKRFINAAQQKLSKLEQLKIIAVTASFGKTSIKNFLAHILSRKYSVYATPGSVNTLMGVVRDINEHLPEDTEVYIVEAGARKRGDVAQITELVRPHYAIVGKLGAAHLEYFKSLDGIRKTKLELLESDRLNHAFVYENANFKNDKTTVFGVENGDALICDIQSDLNGIRFALVTNGERLELFAPQLLGSFQAINICAAVLVAKQLGLDDEAITKAVYTLPCTQHRLQKIEANGKIIIDDSFNGNFDGIAEGIRIASTYTGRKVIVTPGLVETDPALNEKLAVLMDEVFDLVVITGVLNATLLDAHIKKATKIMLHDKRGLTALLGRETHPGDLIYFANDAPSFI